MLYNRCTGIYKFGNNTYPRRIRRRSNLGHIFRGKNFVLWAGKYGNAMFFCGVCCVVFLIILISSKQFYPQSQFIYHGEILEQVFKCKTYV